MLARQRRGDYTAAVRKRIFTVGIVLAVLIGLAWLLWPANQPTAVELANGRTVTLLQISYARDHYPPGNAWMRFAQMFPEFITKPLGLRGRGGISRTNKTLVAWLLWNKPNARVRYMAEDARGNTVEAHGWRSSKTLPDGRVLEGVEIPVFPKRSSRFVLVAEPEQDSRTGNRARFEVRNPARDSYPVWPAYPYPITTTNGNMEFTLKRLVLPSPNSASSDYTEAAFLVIEDGEITTNWFVEKIYMTDATGNSAENNNWMTSNEGDETIIRYKWPLFPEETWRLRVEFSRRASASFATNELWTITEIPIPATNGVETQMMQSHQVQNLTVLGRSLSVSASGGGRRESILKASAGPDSDGYRLTVVHAIDQNGKELWTSRRSWSSGGDYSFAVELEGESKTLDITLALQQSRFVEFIAKPAVAPETEPGSR